MLRLETLIEILLYSAALLGYLPLAPYLQLFPAFAVPAAILFALIAGRKGLFFRERPALLVAVSCFVYYSLQFSHHNVIAPAANLLATLLAIRLAGEKSPRNFLQGFALALFCLAASTLFDLSPMFVLYLLLLLLILTVSLVLLTFRSDAPDFKPAPKELRAILSVALLQPLTALPLIIFLFFILPRTQFPLWNVISMEGRDRAGISDTVQPGDKSAVSSGKATIFRVEMLPLPPEELYWRITVLNTIEGSNWIRKQPPVDGQSALQPGKKIRHTIYLEPVRLQFLPSLNMPEIIIGARGGPTSDRLFPATALPGGRRSYSVISQSRETAIPARSVDQKFYTLLPDNIPPRLQALSRGIAVKTKNGAQRLQLLQDAFSNLKLSYATNGLPTGPNAIEKFLFTEKKGHCELFATSFASALRVAGVPARLVGGYYGGAYNELAGFYTVAEESAHLWVEAWLEGRGWVTIDPSRFAVNFEEARRVKISPLMLRLRIFTDTLSYYWNKAVITYDLESQFSAVSKAGAGLRSFTSGDLPLRRVAVGAGCLLLLAAGFHLATRRRTTPEERLLEAFRKVLLARYGLAITAYSGLHETVMGIENSAVQEFVTIYTGAIYRDRKLTDNERLLLTALLEKIRNNGRE